MNPALVKAALDKVINAQVLVNLVSRRVRQLNSDGHASYPLVADTGSQGAADIPLTRPTGRNRNRQKHRASA
jgi:hypothetical protein